MKLEISCSASASEDWCFTVNFAIWTWRNLKLYFLKYWSWRTQNHQHLAQTILSAIYCCTGTLQEQLFSQELKKSSWANEVRNCPCNHMPLRAGLSHSSLCLVICWYLSQDQNSSWSGLWAVACFYISFRNCPEAWMSLSVKLLQWMFTFSIPPLKKSQSLAAEIELFQHLFFLCRRRMNTMLIRHITLLEDAQMRPDKVNNVRTCQE